MVKRINTWQDALATGKAVLDVGDGIEIPLPTSGNFGGAAGPPGAGVPTGGSALQVIRKNEAGTTTEWATPDKTMVGLSNVNNTADADKPVSTPQAAAMGLKLDKAAPSVTAGVDWNTFYVTTGNWNAQATSVFTGSSNHPVALAGMLSVVARSTGDSVVQRYKVYATGDSYERTLYGAVWSSWAKVALNVDQMFLNPKAPPFNAKGDGVANDSAALQAWLDAGGVRLANGTYRVTTGLTLTGDNRNLYTDNATILGDTADMTVLTVTGNKARVSVTINGNSKANHGIKGTGSGCVYERNLIENIYSTAATARAIEVTTAGGVIVRHNTFRNVTSVGNATFGDGPGFSRAVVLYTTSAATARSYILDNLIDNIVGEEGDGIAILAHDGASNPFLSAKVTIRGNQISNVSRRFIKIQGSDVRVEGNTLTHDGTVPANPSSSIDLIQSDNVTVAGNTITPNPLGNAIASNGTSAVRTKNLVVRDNIIRQDDTKASSSIYLNYATESSVEGNTIHGGGAAVLMGYGINMLISDNKHFGGVASSTSFSANSTNTGVVMRMNVNMNSARTTYVSNTGTGALTELNSTRV